MRIAIILLISFPLYLSCQTTGTVKDSTTHPPDWITEAPEAEGMICAVGMSEPTFYIDDARQFAAEAARKELSRTLAFEVHNIMIDIASEEGSRVEESTVTEISSWKTESVLHESGIIAYWLDTSGVVSGKKNITYALCCIPKKSIQ